jgi:hypothetical protein
MPLPPPPPLSWKTQMSLPHLTAQRGMPCLCLVDFDGDGKVGILEVLGVIDAWGTCN